jgi:hypothetical protein
MQIGLCVSGSSSQHFCFGTEPWHAPLHPIAPPQPQAVPRLDGSVTLHDPSHLIAPPQLPQEAPKFAGVLTVQVFWQVTVPPQLPQPSP